MYYLLYLLVAYFAQSTLQKAIKREKEIGYTLILNNLSPHWINSLVKHDMTSIWQRAGLHAIGMNYWTIGNIKNGISTRFDPESPFYQGWVGGYIVKFTKPKDWRLEDHYKLAVEDQKNWLRIFGDKNPFVEADLSSPKDIGTITVSGYKGNLYEGGIESDTDVGVNNGFYQVAVMQGMVYIMKHYNPNLSIPFVRILPTWNHRKSLLGSYEKIYLKGYIAIIEISKDTKAVLYVNVANFTDKNERKHNNFDQAQRELKRLIQTIEIKKM